MSAVLSEDRRYRYRLDRILAGAQGLTFAYIGVNPSTADEWNNDTTVRKWIGFTQRNGGAKFIVGNVFAYRATDVNSLREVPDPVGPLNLESVLGIARDADVVVPCWGSRNKLPKTLWPQLDLMMDLLRGCGRPVRVFGLTKSDDPKHPLMLGYDTPLVDYF